jgi:hypothetical protein
MTKIYEPENALQIHKKAARRHCLYPGCKYQALDNRTQMCRVHGGGKRCSVENCELIPRSKDVFCFKHGGSGQCQYQNCETSAQAGFSFCYKHGGGIRCGVENCGKARQSGTSFCIKHGGGRMCTVFGCQKFARGSSGRCAVHGGGPRCTAPNCTKSAVSKNALYCRKHSLDTTNHTEYILNMNLDGAPMDDLHHENRLVVYLDACKYNEGYYFNAVYPDSMLERINGMVPQSSNSLENGEITLDYALLYGIARILERSPPDQQFLVYLRSEKFINEFNQGFPILSLRHPIICGPVKNDYHTRRLVIRGVDSSMNLKFIKSGVENLFGNLNLHENGVQGNNQQQQQQQHQQQHQQLQQQVQLQSQQPQMILNRDNHQSMHALAASLTTSLPGGLQSSLAALEIPLQALGIEFPSLPSYHK